MAFEAKQTYKGRPLVRSKNEIYYGSMSDAYVVFMQILTSKKNEAGDDVPDKVNVMLLNTDTSLPPKDRIAKQSMKSGLYNALDFAGILLERSLSGQ